MLAPTCIRWCHARLLVHSMPVARARQHLSMPSLVTGTSYALTGDGDLSRPSLVTGVKALNQTSGSDSEPAHETNRFAKVK